MHEFQGRSKMALREVGVRCFQHSAVAYAATKIAMSKFDQDAGLPYERLAENLEIVKKR